MNHPQTVIKVRELADLVTQARRLAATISTESESSYYIPNARSWALDLLQIADDIADVLS